VWKGKHLDECRFFTRNFWGFAMSG